MIRNYLAILMFLAVPHIAMASTVSINTTPGQHYRSLHGIRDDTATRGSDLVGMVVTASYLDGTTEQVTWAPFRSRGQAIGNDFGLSFDWQYFELSLTKSLASLSLDARTGNAIFDINHSKQAGEDTYGTGWGWSFYVGGGYDPVGNIDVTYSNSFSVAGHEQATDAYTHMLIDFTGLEGGGLLQDFQFKTDFDSLEVAGDFTPVPLPASLLMFASAFGLLGAGVVRKRTTG